MLSCQFLLVGACMAARVVLSVVIPVSIDDLQEQQRDLPFKKTVASIGASGSRASGML